MLVGVPREVKNNEFRVAITPAGVHVVTTSSSSTTPVSAHRSPMTSLWPLAPRC